MQGVDGGKRRQVVRDILAELVGCLPIVQHGQGYDPDLLARLYLLRDVTASADGLGAARVAVADWINRAAALVRDEEDRDQALRLLRRAQTRLADAAVTHRPPR
ncbi:MAG: hypothetical protein ACRDQW_09960 [Haloechinothrix sp.]